MIPTEQNSTTREKALPVMELRQIVLHVLTGKRKQIDTLPLDGLMKSIDQLLKNGSDPNAANPRGRACLHHIASHWDMEKRSGVLNTWVRNLVQNLIQAGADVNKRDEQGKASLHYAAMKGNVEMVRTLLSAGAEPDLADMKNNTPLLLALENSKTSNAMILDIVQQLIDAGANVNVTNPSHGTTALHYACDLGDTKIVNLLLSRGASLTATDENGFNALLHAIRANHAEIVPILIDNGFDVNLVMRSKSATPMTAIHFAITNKNMEILKCLLERGADPNRLKSMGKSVLIFVLTELSPGDNRFRALELLLSQKADVHADDLSNAKVLFELLVLKGLVREIRLFGENGFDFGRFSPRAPEDLSPLHESVRRGFLSTVYHRLSVWLECDKKGSLDLNHIDASGETPLCMVAVLGLPECVNLLIKWGADVDRVNSRRCSPLQLAVAAMDPVLQRSTRLNFSCIRTLVEAGAKLGNILKELVPDSPADVTAQLLEAPNLGQCKKITQCVEKGELIVKYRTLYESTKEIADPSEHVGDHMPIQLQQYYNSCKAEIYLLKNTKFYNSLSYHDVLADKIFYRRVRDDQVYRECDEKDLTSRFPLYGQDFHWHFNNAKKMHELWENSVKNLGLHLRFHHDTYYLIIENILKRLRYTDLHSVAKSR